MSQETLKNYTLQTLNFGTAFLTRLSNIPLPEEMSNVKKELSDCFTELQKVWKSVNKLAFKFEGNYKMDNLKLKLKQMETNQAIIIKPNNQLINRSRSIESLFEKQENINPITEAIKLSKTTSPPYSNWSPRVPTKHKFKIKSTLSVDASNGTTNHNIVEKNKLQYVNFTRDITAQSQPQEKSEMFLTSLPNRTRRLSDAVNSTQPTHEAPATEQGYIKLESERRLPPRAKFSYISKAKNVNVNHWKLGERYCGIADDILYIFFAFQDVHAEISMDIPNLYIGKGFETNEDYGKSVLFQSREVHLSILFSNEDLRDKCYQASFKAQNKYNSLKNTKQYVPSPLMPRPYAKKDNSPVYLNTSLDVEKNVKYPAYNLANQSANTVDSDEDYMEMVQSNS